MAAVSLFAAAVRLRLLELPLERDEGEYAYAGQLLLAGIAPYTDAYNMKFPGTYYAYAAILALFGESTRGIHLGLLLVNTATIWAVFLLGRPLFGNFAGAVAGCAFALLSLDRMILGVFGHATHFVILPVVLGIWLVLRSGDATRRGTLCASGALLGLAILMKQHALFFVPLGAALAARAALRRGPGHGRAAAAAIAWLAAGVALPLASVAAVLLAEGVWDRFWFWTFTVAADYATEVPLSRAPSAFLSALRIVTLENRPLWLAAAAGGVALVVRRDLRDARVPALGLLCASLLALCPGFRFRDHYFILLLPAVALGVGVAADSALRVLSGALPRRAAVSLVGAACVALAAAYVVGERHYLFWMSPQEVSRARYGRNPFVESPEIARYIRERTGPDERIAVLGSEPQIYFHAGRRSATGYLYVYPLMGPGERPRAMQQEMIREIEGAHPSYLVVVQIVPSWLVRRGADPLLAQWIGRYTQKCYERVGIAAVDRAGESYFVWDADVASYSPRSKNLILTYRRRDVSPCRATP